MTFLSPGWLLLLLPVAGLAAAYVVLQRRRRHHAVRFTNLDLLASVAPRRPGWRRHVAAGAAALGLASLVVALARPVRDERVPREAATVVLAVDVSASMTATDVAPTRLAAAQEAAAGFVEDLPDGFQVGLVAFDQAARLLAAPTTDHAAVIAALERLRPGSGTATGDGIDAALDAIAATAEALDVPAAGAGADGAADAAPGAAIVLLSDGTATVGGSLEAATQEAVERGVPVTTIAYGTDQGTVTVQGRTVPVPADEAAMEEVAAATGGTSFTAGSDVELDRVYGDIQRRLGSVLEPREVLRTFVGIAVVAFLVAVAGSLVWSGRFL